MKGARIQLLPPSYPILELTSLEYSEMYFILEAVPS
jgi:hypothetical protein